MATPTLSDGRKMVNGSDIMLFIDGKSVAHASSHSLNITAETEDINTKDAGVYGMTEVSRLNWEVSADHFYTTDGYTTFFDAMNTRKPIQVVFALKDAATSSPANAEVINTESTGDGYWAPSTAYGGTSPNYVYVNYYYGDAIITSLNWTADAGSKATFQATLAGQGPISKNVPAQA